MRDIILSFIMIGFFIIGYFIMVRFDSFLDENRKYITTEKEKKEPSSVMLTEHMSEEEILSEIQQFRNKHKNTRILIYSSDEEIAATKNSTKENT